jgi:SPP1 gp7 family putative phage head morphogenesis protein
MSETTSGKMTIQNALRTNERLAALEIGRTYKEMVAAIRSDLAKLYERYSVAGELTHAEMSKYNRLASLERQIINEIRPAMRANTRLMEKLAQVQYEESFYRHAWDIDQKVGVSLRWGSLNPKTIEAAVRSPLRELSERALSQQTWVRIDRAITAGLVRGVGLPEMMRDVRAASDLSKADAMRIVRTEAHRAREQGNYDVTMEAVEQGVKLKRRWQAQLDDRTRDSHASLDGEEVGPDEPFSNGLMMPGDPTGAAEETINCRCGVIDIIEGYEPELRRTREEGIQPYQNFSDWASEHGITGSRYGQEYNFTRR